MNKYLKQLLDAINAKNLEKQGVMTKALDAGTTPNEEEEKQIEAIDAELETLQKNYDRMKAMVEATEKAAATATPVAGATPAQAAASAAGDPNPAAPATVVEPKLEKGVGLAMLVRAKLTSAHLAKSQGEFVSASQLLKNWGAPEKVQNVAKAVIGTTTDENFAAALVDQQNLVGEFIELLRPRTIIDQIQGFRRVPFNVKIATQTGASIVNWVGETQRKPVSNPTFGSTSLGFAKIAGIVPFSDELLRFSNPKVDVMVRDDLSESIIQFMNDQFIDPGKAEAAESPASVLNGVTAIVASGITVDAIKADLRKLRGQFITANLSMTGAHYIMSETMASFMADLTDPLGNPAFRGMDAPVGQKTLGGLPVVEAESAGNIIALIKPSEILLADDGGIDLSVSQEATLTYNNGTDDVQVNLWQNNLIAIRAERYARWKKRRAQAAGYIDYSAQTLS